MVASAWSTRLRGGRLLGLVCKRPFDISCSFKSGAAGSYNSKPCKHKAGVNSFVLLYCNGVSTPCALPTVDCELSRRLSLRTDPAILIVVTYVDDNLVFTNFDTFRQDFAVH